MKVPPCTKDFDPSAHTHLARTLDSVGHRAAASQVRLVREQKLRRAEYFRVRATQPRFMDLSREAWWKDHLNFRAILKRWFNAFFGFVFGYGHAPMRAFGVSVAVVVVAAIFYGITYGAGQMAPNSPVILASAEWQAAVAQGCTTVRQPGCNMPLHIWDGSPSILEGSLTHRDYETFNAFAYGFDLFIPLEHCRPV